SGVISRFPAAVYDAGECYGIRRDQSPALQLVRHACGRGRESANFTDESKRVGVFGSGDAWRPHQMVRQFDVHINQRMRMRTERGFSLIEAMIALAILSFGLLAVAGMQSFALTGNVDASELTVVSNVAADMMERKI